MFPRWFVVALVVSTLVHFALAAVLPPAEDELYYWCWGQQLQASYYDHPPMTAYLIRLSTELFGDTLFALRLPACLCSLGMLVVLGSLTRPVGLLVLVLLTPLFSLGGIIITPDAPLLFFWAAYVAWLVRVHQHLSVVRGPLSVVGRENESPRAAARGLAAAGPGLWALGGVVLGLGILSKYTMGLAIPAAFLSFVLAKNGRSWLFGFAGHLAVAFVVALPILVFNVQQNFAPLLYQWRHTMVAPAPTIRFLPEYIGAQFLLVGYLPFTLLPWVVARFRTFAADPRLRVCACLYLLPFAFFFYKAARGRLEANWPLVAYIGFWPLVCAWLEEVRESLWWRRLTYASFAAPLIATVVIAVHMARPIGALPPDKDRLTAQKVRFEVSHQMGEAVRRYGGSTPVFAPTYQWTSLLRFQHVEARQVPGLTRASHFTRDPTRMEQFPEVLVLHEGPLPPRFTTEFGPPELLDQFPIVVRGRFITLYQLLRYTKKPEATGTAAR